MARQEISKRQTIYKRPSAFMRYYAELPRVLQALFKKFCKRDFCDEVRDFKIPEPEAVAS